MKIEKFKKVGKSKYKVYLSNNELTLYEDVIIKYNLLVKKNLNINELNDIMDENRYYEVYNISLSYIEIKMRSTSELRKYLEKKEFDLDLIEKVIDKLKEEGYLNDEKYIEAFINDKIYLSTDGPFKIKQSLINLNIDEVLIDNYLLKIGNSVWLDKIKKIVEKRKKLAKNLSYNMFINKTKMYLYNLGYSSSLIEECLYNVKLDNNALETEYKKAYKKYSKKYSDERLESNIKNYLYRKGYTIDEINSIIKP